MSANKPPPTPEAATGPAAAKSPRSRKKQSPALSGAHVTGEEESTASMSEHPHVHVPQQGIHTWRDFAVHIAVVAIGLLLAIGLQQIVEAIHHQRQRAHLEAQMRETFVANQQLAADNRAKLDHLQAYLRDLRLTVGARIEGRPLPPAPAAFDPRNYTYVPPPSLGAYEASKANGSVALLSLDTIRLYDRTGVTIGVVQTDLQRFLGAIAAWRSFAGRYDTKPSDLHRLPQVDLDLLSTSDLIEYRTLIGNMIGASEAFETRLRTVQLQSRVILDGARTEAELRAAISRMQGN